MLEGTVRTARGTNAAICSGIAVPRPAWLAASVRGTEHIGPEDTLDSDYGRLLERVYAGAEKGWRARPAFAPSELRRGSGRPPWIERWRARQDLNLRPSA